MHAEAPLKPQDIFEATISYIDPAAPAGGINFSERDKSTFTLVRHPMRIESARLRPERFGLETTGFTWLNRPTACHNFSDPAEVENVYFPESAQLVKEMTGAELVLVFGHVMRDGALKGTRHAPVYNAHVDYDVPTIQAVARKLLPPEEHERRLAQRIVLVNIWRPLEVVESSPLALCDSTSVAREDLIYGPIANAVAGVPNAAGWNLAHNPAHRWYYVPRMTPDEVYVFRLCDTDPDRPQWAAHCSIDEPFQLPDARPRRSIELRTLAFVP